MISYRIPNMFKKNSTQKSSPILEWQLFSQNIVWTVHDYFDHFKLIYTQKQNRTQKNPLINLRIQTLAGCRRPN